MAEKKNRKTDLPYKKADGTCNAVTRSQSYCKKKAGSGTDHPGVGRCNLHGGLTPIVHGMKSEVVAEMMGNQLNDELGRELLNEDTVLDFTVELAKLKRMTIDLNRRFDRSQRKDGGEAAQQMTWEDFYKWNLALVREIASTTEKLNRIKHGETIRFSYSLEQVEDFCDRLLDILEEVLGDESIERSQVVRIVADRIGVAASGNRQRVSSEN